MTTMTRVAKARSKSLTKIVISIDNTEGRDTNLDAFAFEGKENTPLHPKNLSQKNVTHSRPEGEKKPHLIYGNMKDLLHLCL